MQYPGSPLGAYAQQLFDFHKQNKAQEQPIARFLELLEKPFEPERLHGDDPQVAWTHLILLFLDFGIAESELIEYDGVTPFTLTVWRGGTQRPDPVYQKKLVEHFRNILNVRACVHL